MKAISDASVYRPPSRVAVMDYIFEEQPLKGYVLHSLGGLSQPDRNRNLKVDGFNTILIIALVN